MRAALTRVPVILATLLRDEATLVWHADWIKLEVRGDDHRLVGSDPDGE